MLWLCVVCHKKADIFCSACKTFDLVYCSRNCQELDLESHKKFCGYFTIKVEEKEGKDGLKSTRRSIVAAKYLNRGDRILEELPLFQITSKDFRRGNYILEELPWFLLAQLPKPEKEKKDFDHCVCCGTNLSGFSSGRCSRCKWPVCGENCEKHKIHAENECEILATRKIDYDSLAVHEDRRILLILRAGAMKEKKPEVWNELMKRADEISKAGQDSVYNREEISKSEDTMKNLNISNEEMEIYKKFYSLLNFTSIFYEAHSNRVNLKGEKGIQSRVGDFLYPVSSYFSFSCAPNCNFGIDDSPDFKIEIRAARDIKRGEELSIHHPRVPLFLGTIERRRIIKERFGYLCKCKRCSDPTEFGTFFSGIVCNDCRPQGENQNEGEQLEENVGYFLPLTPESEIESESKEGEDEEKDSSSLVQCNGCKTTRPYSFFKDQLLENYADATDASSLPSIEMFQDECENVKLMLSELSGKILHPNHFKIHQLHTRLCKFYAEAEFDISSVPSIRCNYFLEGLVRFLRIRMEVENGLLNGSFMHHQCQLQELIAEGLFILVQRQAPSNPLRLVDERLMVDLLKKLKESLKAFEIVIVFRTRLMPTCFLPKTAKSQLERIKLLYAKAVFMEIKCFSMQLASRGTRIILELLTPFLQVLDAYIPYFISVS